MAILLTMLKAYLHTHTHRERESCLACMHKGERERERELHADRSSEPASREMERGVLCMRVTTQHFLKSKSEGKIVYTLWCIVIFFLACGLSKEYGDTGRWAM